MAIAGALEIQLFAGITRLQKDMNQAKSIVGSSMAKIESAVGMAKSALGALGIGLGVGYFVSLTKGAIDAADKINDLSQSTGIAVQALGQYKLATEQSGTTLEGLARGVKGLAIAFTEHGGELKAAGINATTTDGRMRQLAEMFSKMPDGIEKTTLAVKLFGKAGMDLIPMLNMGAAGLDEASEKSAKYAAVMATLAPQADKFNDTMAELGMASKVVGLSLINDALPAMTRIAAAMALAAHESGALKAAWVGFGGIAWEGVFKPLTALIKGTTANLMELNAKMLRFFGDNKGAAYEFQRAARLWKEVAALEDTASAAAPKKEFDQAGWMANYKKMMGALGVGSGERAKADAELKKLLDLGTKGEIDALIEREKAWREEQNAINDLRNAGYDEDAKLIALGMKGEEDAAVARTQLRQQELIAINDFRNAEAAKLTEMGEFAREAARGIQRGFSDGLFDIMQGKFDNMGDRFKSMIDRMVADALAAKLAAAMFGDMDKTGNIGGWIGTAMKFFGGGKAGGGAVSGGSSYLVGERGPELFTPGTSGNITPNDRLGGSVNVTNVFQITGPTDRRSQAQIATAAGEGVQRAMARNT